MFGSKYVGLRCVSMEFLVSSRLVDPFSIEVESICTRISEQGYRTERDAARPENRQVN